MLDEKFVARCPVCGIAGSLAREWKIPIREEDETGKKGKIISFRVYPSGCLCGQSYEEPADEKSKYKLNLPPSWKKLQNR